MRQSDQISRRLKLRQLEILLTVVQTGSMAKASALLAITQPVISKTIADLEATLGLRLLERSSQGVEPTLYGRALIERSITLFNDLRTSVSELEFMSSGGGGELRIGSSDVIAFAMLGPILEKLSQRFPRLRFEVVTGLPLQDLLVHKIDLVIGRLPSVIPNEVSVTALYDDEAYIVSSERNPVTRRRKVALSELIDRPWCGNRLDTFPFSLWAEAFRQRGLQLPNNVASTPSLLAQMSLAATGHFLAILPRTLMHFAASRLALRKIALDFPAPIYPVGILTLKHRTLNPVVRHFIDCAREIADPFTKRGPTRG